MRTALQVLNEIKELRRQQNAVPANARDRDKRLFELQGRLQALDAELSGVLNATAGGVGGGVAGRSMTEQAFGPRASFKGVKAGFRAAITIPAAPAVGDPAIPGFADYPRGFADTLIQAPTEGSVTYLRRGSSNNAAAQWKTADGDKAESTYTWVEKTAPLTWIAHHSPISKTEASDWGALDSIMRTQMMVGLAQAKSREALIGDNEDGITGVLNTVGIQTYDPAEDGKVDDNVYDSIRRMATRVRVESGFEPTHVAMSPVVAEELDLLKGEDGHYLTINVGGEVWNLKVVQDVSLTVVDDEDTVHNGVVVYAPIGATWYTKEADNVEVGLVDDQFIKNAYTLLAEGRNALAVRFPDAFCYCEDAIETAPIAGS